NLVVLPATVQTEWMSLAWPNAWRDFWLGSVLSQAMLVGVALWVASLARSWSHFLAAGAALFVGQLVFRQLQLPELLATETIPPSLAMRRSGGWALIGVVLAGWQYLSPRPRVAGSLGVALLVAFPFVVSGSDEPLAEWVPDRPHATFDYASPDSVTASLLGVRLESRADNYATPRTGPALTGWLAIDTPGSTVAVLRNPVVRLQPSERTARPPASVALLEAFSFVPGQQLQGYTDLSETQPRTGQWSSEYEIPLMAGSRDDLESALEASEGIEIEFELDLYRPTLGARELLRPGARLMSPEAVLEVHSIEELQSDVRIRSLSHATTWDMYWLELGPPQLLVNES
ncbi:MAG: hypothetical protein P8188_17310, partial [Gemmatimonadota bacterium]